MEKKSQTPGPFQAAQLASQGNKVVIMDPHKIAFPQQGDQGSSKAAIDAPIVPVLVFAQSHMARKAVEERPESAITEPRIEVVNLIL